jgi:hypothetical protein
MQEEQLMTTTTNGRERKSLAEQIDRLDGILDGLAQGLEQAVAAAVEQAVGVAVREAVKAVLHEVLTSPQVLEKIRGAAPEATPAPAESPKTGFKKRVVQLCGRLKAGVQGAVQAVGMVCSKVLGSARRAAAATRDRLGVVARFKVPLLLAVGMGTAVGVGAYFAGPWLAAAAGWVAGFATSLALQAWSALRRTLGASGVGVL